MVRRRPPLTTVVLPALLVKAASGVVAPTVLANETVPNRLA